MRALSLLLVVLCAGCAGTRMSSDLMDLAQSTRPGGTFHIEFGADGRLVEAGAEVPLDTAPEACRAAADAAFPGGRQTGAERLRAGDGAMWMIAKQVDGRPIEILVTDDGTVRGGEEVLARSAWPAAVVAAAEAAVPGATLERVERVWGAEARGAEAYHVKFDAGGDSVRVSLTADAAVVRVVRRLRAQVRVPR